MTSRSRFGLLALVLVLAGFISSCGYLRDKEPWDQTLQYRRDSSGVLIIEPLVLHGDTNYGVVHVVNDTAERRGFAIRDLAVFEEIPAGLTVTVEVDEAQDDETYSFEDHVADDAEWQGQLVIDYVAEEFRNR
jgi:hypothetical protein